MVDKISAILSEAKERVQLADSQKIINDIKVDFLGKSGKVTGLLKGMKDVAPQDRPKVGQAVNGLRVEIETLITEKEAVLKANETQERFKKEEIDITLPGKQIELGTLHPITMVKN